MCCENQKMLHFLPLWYNLLAAKKICIALLILISRSPGSDALHSFLGLTMSVMQGQDEGQAREAIQQAKKEAAEAAQKVDQSKNAVHAAQVRTNVCRLFVRGTMRLGVHMLGQYPLSGAFDMPVRTRLACPTWNRMYTP